jgi:hypothetical protein
VPVTLEAPADDISTNDSTPALGGGGAPLAFVTVRVFAGSVAAGPEAETLQAMPASDGTWTLDSQPLGDGTYTAQAEQTDIFGRFSRSDARSFTVDAAAPVVAVTAPPDGSSTGNTTPSVSGLAGTASGDSASVTVRLWAGSDPTPVATQTTGVSGGQWSIAPPGPLADDTYTAEAEQQDAAGNVGRSTRQTFRVDSTRPAVNLVHPSSGGAVGAPTVFDGTAGNAATDSPTVTVKVYNGAAVTGTPKSFGATRSGANWSVTASPQLADGVYTAQAEQADTTANLGTSAPHTFTVDTAKPGVTIATPDDTNDSTPTFTGAAGTASGDSATVTVKVYDGLGTLVQTIPATHTGGTWSATAGPTLAEGSYSVQAEQLDAAGNLGQSAKPGFKVDTTAPAPTIAHPLAGATIGNTPPAFDGGAGNAAGDSTTVTVKVYTGVTATGSPIALTTARSGTTWSVTAGSALASGTYTAVAEQEDAVHNLGKSATRTFQVDATPPAVTLTKPAAGIVTADTQPHFSGGAGTASGDQTAIALKIYAGSSASGSAIQTLSTTASGGSWGASPATALGEGTYTARAEQSDSAGNAGRSSANTFVVDTTGPTVSITLGPSSPDGQSGWYVTMPTVHVVADDPHFGSLSCMVDGSAATVTPTPVSSHSAEGDVQVTTDGNHSVQCTATDAAGNSTQPGPTTFKVDRAAPNVALDHPAAGASTASMVFDGTAGNAPGDAGAVTVRVYSGGDTSSLLQSQSTSSAAGSWSLVASPVLDHGLTYTVRAEQTDAAGNTGRSSPHTFGVPYTLLAAGDIASCSSSGDEATAALLAQLAGKVAALGDVVYESGTATEFSGCYQPSWGAAKARTSPAVGNHEYVTAGASGYFGYFGAAAGNPSEGYYSYNLGPSWHVIVLNTNTDCAAISCALDSDQERWLKADLNSNTSACVVAYFHHPRFSSYLDADVKVKPLWDDLAAKGVDLVLNGHAHNYERYAPQTPAGVADPGGIREIIAGTGGRNHHAFYTSFDANSVAHDDQTFGVLQLTLNSGGYAWNFVPVPGTGAFTDSGSASCH